MDKYEYNVKSDQIKKLYSRKDFEAAAKIADEIDWYRVKDNAMINRVADIYENTKQYEKAKEILLIAYERSPLGRQLAYKLTILALRTKNFVEADEFYQDFVEMSPSDVSQYLLKYRIAKAKGEDIDVLIQILEAYIDVEMDERWQYELAKLYHEAGQDDKCIAMCDELVLWFNDGKYVDKAKELKKLITGVLEEYNKRYAPENLAQTSEDISDTSETISDEENFSSMESLAEALASDIGGQDESDEREEMAAGSNTYSGDETYADNYRYADVNDTDGEDEFKLYETHKVDEAGVPDKDVIDEPVQSHVPSEEERRALEMLKAMEEAALEAQRAADLAKELVEEAKLKVKVLRGEEHGGSETGLGQREVHAAGQYRESVRNLHENGSNNRGIHGTRNGNDRFAGMTMEEIRRQLDEEEERLSGGADSKEQDSKIEIFEFDKDKEGKGKNIGEELTKTAEIDIDEIKLNLNNSDDIYNTANIQAALAKSMEKLLEFSEDKSPAEIRNVFMDLHEYDTEIGEELEAAVEEVQPETEEEPETEMEEVQPETEEEPETEMEEVQPETEEEPETEAEEVQPETEEEPETEAQEVQPETEEEPETEAQEVQPETEEEPETETQEVQPETEEEPEAETQEVQPETVKEPVDIPKEENSVEMAESRGTSFIDDVSKQQAVYNERSQREFENEGYPEDCSNEPTKRINRDEINRLLRERRDIYQTVPLSPLLNQEEDGQIGLAESETSEEQIEGQMTIEEVISELEKKSADDSRAKLEAVEAEERELADIETEDDMAEIEDDKESSAEPNIWKVETLEEGNRWKEETLEAAEEESSPEHSSDKKQQIPEEYRSLFNDFVGTGSMEEDIAKTLDNLINNFVMDGTSRTNNVIVTGTAKIGKTTLGLSIIKAANKGRNRSGRKVAKVKASVLNKRGVALAMTQILGTDLIIEQAGSLMPNTLVDLMIAMKNYTEEMLIVLEDDKAAIDRMLDNTPDIRGFFTNRLDIHEMEINDMVKIAKEYAAVQFYEIDEMGELALFAKLDDISGRNPVLSIEDIQEVVDDAIAHANRFGLGKLFGKIRKGKGEMSILTEQDFL